MKQHQSGFALMQCLIAAIIVFSVIAISISTQQGNAKISQRDAVVNDLALFSKDIVNTVSSQGCPTAVGQSYTGSLNGCVPQATFSSGLIDASTGKLTQEHFSMTDQDLLITITTATN